MKKKKTIIAMICILVLWIAIGVVDYRCVHSFETPNSLLCSQCSQSGFSVYNHPISRVIQIHLVYSGCADSKKKAAPKSVLLFLPDWNKCSYRFLVRSS